MSCMSLELRREIWARDVYLFVLTGGGEEDQNTEEHVHLRSGQRHGEKLGDCGVIQAGTR